MNEAFIKICKVDESLHIFMRFVKDDNQIGLIIYLTSTDDWEYWLREEKKKFYRTERLFVKIAR
jgi:hypothetical protein